MGLKVSTTCELTFGEQAARPIGWLVGDVHDGIAQMFKVIEYARMMVGTKAIATLSTGYLNALEYAKDRVQGADLTEITDKDAPRVTITHHPDVRRSADDAEGVRRGHARARPLHRLATRTRWSSTRPARAADADLDTAERVNDLLLPIVKGVGSERSYEQLARVAADPRRLRLPAGLPDRAVHPRLQDRHALRGHHRDPGAGPLLPQDRARPGPGAHAPRRRGPGLRQGRRRQRHARGRARAARQGARGRAGHRRRARRLRDEVAGATPPSSTRSARTPRACCSASATSSSAGCCCARPRSPSRRSTGRRPRRTARSTRARSPPRSSSPTSASRC